MRIPRRSLAALAVVAATALGGCTISDNSTPAPATGGGSIKPIPELKGVQIKVSSKEFDEELLLGQIAIVALQAAGASPVDKTNITGSDNVRKALTSGQVDMYWEYTGTAWVSYFKQTRAIPDVQQQFQAVKDADAKNGITWWAPAPANDTYAIAANPGAASKNNVKTLSDYANLVKQNPGAAAICVGSEFRSRDDGLPGLEKLYGFTLPAGNVHLVQDAVVYPTVGKGATCGFGSVAATDGRIPANNLVLLQDDKHFFPLYNPAISIRTPLAQKYPQLEQLFTSISAKLDTATLTDLNKKVSVDGQKPNAVARDWLKSTGFIG